MIYHANINQKKKQLPILVCEKVYFQSKNTTRKKEIHFIMKKWRIQQDDITILSLYGFNNSITKFMKQKMIEQ